MATYTRDKKYREVQTEIRKKQKQKQTDDGSFMMGGEYVDAYRNISVAAIGEKDLNKDLEDKGISSKIKEVGGPSAEMFHKLAKYQIKCVKIIYFQALVPNPNPKTSPNPGPSQLRSQRNQEVWDWC